MQCRKCKKEIPDISLYCLYCGVKQQPEARTAKSRGNGTGTVYKRGKTWTAKVTIEYSDDGGKPRIVSRTKGGFKTKKEAVTYLPTLKLAPREKPKQATFKQIYEAWQPTHRAGKSTMDCYRAAYKYFEPVYRLYISDIDIDDLQDCLDECGKGRRTKENMKALCGLLYKFAIPRHYVTLNMGQYLIVSGDSGTKNALPDDALPKLEKHADGVFGASIVLCQCYLGFRPAEFVALDAANYNREERAFVGGAKTEAGTDRTVTVSPKIQPYIDAAVKDKIGGAVFVDEDGKPFTPARYRELFYSVLEKCGIDNPIVERDGKKFYTYTPHSCRHTFATLMKRVDGADKDKLALIGHTSDEMLRYYQDVNYADLRKITDAL
jgi:integrase